MRPNRFKAVNLALLALSVALLAAAAWYGASALVAGISAACVVAYGIVYTPWDAPGPVYRDRRNRFASALAAAGLGFFFAAAVSYVIVWPGPDWPFPVAGVVLLGLATYRALCELAYGVTGRGRFLEWFA